MIKFFPVLFRIFFLENFPNFHFKTRYKVREKKISCFLFCAFFGIMYFCKIQFFRGKKPNYVNVIYGENSFLKNFLHNGNLILKLRNFGIFSCNCALDFLQLEFPLLKFDLQFNFQIFTLFS